MTSWLRASAVLLAACSGGERAEPAAAPDPAAARQRAEPEPEVEDEAPARRQPMEAPPSAAACDSGDGCLELALRERRAGRAVEAAAALDRGCAMGHAPSCYRLALAYRAGEGVEADERRVEDLLRQACGAGSTAACDAMGH